MKFFAGIVPPDHLYREILKIQTQHGDNRIEPHITLRPPVNPFSPEQWVEKINNVCSAFPSFPIHLPGTGNFGQRVLFINIKSPELQELYKEIKKAIKPEEPIEQQDNRPFHPHLTLGRSWCGFTKEDFKNMALLAKEMLKEQPDVFTAQFVRIYVKRTDNKKYEKFQDLPLLG